MIRKAPEKDLCRIAEILVYNNRVNFLPIFGDEEYSFCRMSVENLMKEYAAPEKLSQVWVYDDGILRGLVQIRGTEVVKLFVDVFFQNRGIGAELLEFAVRQQGADHLYALEKNLRGIAFYGRHGFFPSGEWEYEEGTTEKLILLKKTK